MKRTYRSPYPDDETRIREENQKLRAMLAGLNAALAEIKTATGGNPSLLSADARAELEELFRVMTKEVYGMTDEQVDEVIARVKAEAAELRGETGA